MEQLQTLKKQIKAGSKGRSIILTKHFTGFEFEKVGDLKDKVVVITGASRGLGLAMALRCARDGISDFKLGAKIAILAKTVKPHPKLNGTIFTAAEAVEKAGGQALPIQCNMIDLVGFSNNKKAIENGIAQVIAKWGKIDVLINNASALHIANTQEISMKRYDLITEVNIRGTYFISKLCLPYLKKAQNPHILNICPPFYSVLPPSTRANKSNWFAPHFAESLSKFGMTLCAYGMSDEFKEYGIGVNTIWPHTAEDSASVRNVFGGAITVKHSRKPSIFGDAAYVIITSNSKQTTGQFFLDDEVLASTGLKDLQKYKTDPSVPDYELFFDFFC